jgi:hypothetical protein
MAVTAASTFTFDTDKNQMSSFSHVEVPVRGPDPVTTLVIISGIVVTAYAFDIDPLMHEDQVEGFEAFIETQYRLPRKEDWVDAAAYAWLAAMDDDDRHGDNGYWIETIDAQAKFDGRVQLHIVVHLKSDARLDRIGYQIHVLGSQPRSSAPSDSLAQDLHKLVGESLERPWRP